MYPGNMLSSTNSDLQAGLQAESIRDDLVSIIHSGDISSREDHLKSNVISSLFCLSLCEPQEHRTTPDCLSSSLSIFQIDLMVPEIF